MVLAIVLIKRLLYRVLGSFSPFAHIPIGWFTSVAHQVAACGVLRTILKVQALMVWGCAAEKVSGDRRTLTSLSSKVLPVRYIIPPARMPTPLFMATSASRMVDRSAYKAP